MAARARDESAPEGYAKARAELDAILREIDSNNVDIDVLSERVKRASFLLEWCLERITAIEATVEEIVASLPELGDDDDDDDYEDDDDDDDDDDE